MRPRVLESFWKSGARVLREQKAPPSAALLFFLRGQQPRERISRRHLVEDDFSYLRHAGDTADRI
jgi:hypothetical protein